MKTTRTLLVLAAAMAIWGLSAGNADEVRTNDGSVIIGEVTVIDGGSVKVKTEHSGEVSTKKELVKSVSIERQIMLYFANGEQIACSVSPSDADGRIRLNLPEGATRNVPLADIVNMSPPDRNLTKEAAEVKWNGSGELGGVFTEGNTRSKTIYGIFKVKRKDPGGVALFELKGAYGESEGDLIEQYLKAYLRYEYNLTERTYLFFDDLVEHNYPAQIRIRNVQSVGPGYYFMKDDMTELKGETGPSYTIEIRRTGEDRYFIGWKTSAQLDHKFSEEASLNAIATHYANLEDFDGWRAEGSVGVKRKLSKSLFGRIAYEVQYENMPPPDTKHTDHRLTLTIGFEF
ncbi:MAG TPA: DUF481 domain-containing protein [Candidatus Brocadiia bacterium]|nr:DUF481 domain-containing protein [Candidatus Brocadiia bacterium]